MSHLLDSAAYEEQAVYHIGGFQVYVGLVGGYERKLNSVG